MTSSARPTLRVNATTVNSAGRTEHADVVASEEPLGIRVVAEVGGRRQRTDIAVTMRTPGDDLDLAVGFLLTEGVLSADGLWRVEHCRDPSAVDAHNVVDVFLKPGVSFDPEKFSRHVYTTSSCGICGKASLDQVRVAGVEPPGGEFRVSESVLAGLPERLAPAQPLFAKTGGIHAAALFDSVGELVELREDVGRHNAVDKIAGWMFREGVKGDGHIMYTTGRLTSEMVIKCALMGIPVLASRSGFTAWGVELANQVGLTLIGRMRGQRFHCLSGAERLVFDTDTTNIPDEDKKHRRKGAV